MIKVILSLVLGAPSEFDGVLGAMVIAGEAGEARAVMTPSRLFSLTAKDVVDWADICASPAFHATVAVHMERLVRDEIAGEVTTEEARVDAWPSSLVKKAYASDSVDDVGCELAEAFGSLVLLFLFLGVGVYVHEGQAHIRLWHEEREGCIEANASLTQVFFQYLDGLADVVACRAEGVCIVPLGLQTKSGDEFSDQHGGTPAMHWKAETDSFAQGQLGCEIACGMVGNEDQLFVGGLAELLGCPTGVASS